MSDEPYETLNDNESEFKDLASYMLDLSHRKIVYSAEMGWGKFLLHVNRFPDEKGLEILKKYLETKGEMEKYIQECKQDHSGLEIGV